MLRNIDINIKYCFTERVEKVESLVARLNILLSDFADLVAELSRVYHSPTSSSAAAAVPVYTSAKRNTFDHLAVGGRFG